MHQRPEIQAGDLRDHHVLRIAHHGGGSADVARDEKRDGLSCGWSNAVATIGAKTKRTIS